MITVFDTAMTLESGTRHCDNKSNVQKRGLIITEPKNYYLV